MQRPQRLALLACCLALGGCSPGPYSVALADLRETPERWAGSEVQVSGTLRSYGDREGYPEHFWIENEALDRVRLESHRELGALVGWTVEVQGTFRYDRRAGRRIEVASIASAR